MISSDPSSGTTGFVRPRAPTPAHLLAPPSDTTSLSGRYLRWSLHTGHQLRGQGLDAAQFTAGAFSSVFSIAEALNKYVLCV